MFDLKRSNDLLCANSFEKSLFKHYKIIIWTRLYNETLVMQFESVKTLNFKKHFPKIWIKTQKKKKPKEERNILT